MGEVSGLERQLLGSSISLIWPANSQHPRIVVHVCWDFEREGGENSPTVGTPSAQQLASSGSRVPTNRMYSCISRVFVGPGREVPRSEFRVNQRAGVCHGTPHFHHGMGENVPKFDVIMRELPNVAFRG